MVDFTLDLIEELVDGRVRATWTTVADDGFPLTETADFTPSPDNDLEEEVATWLESRKAKRELINSQPKAARPKRPAVKRTTAQLDEAAATRIQQRLGQSQT